MKTKHTLKNIAITSLALFGSNLALQAAVWSGPNTGNWEDASNWNGGTVPNGESALWNVNRTVTHATGTVDEPTTILIQNTNGRAVFDFTGGSLTATSNMNIGHNDTSAATDGIGVVDLSGGTLNVASVNIGANNFAIGELNATGGTLNFTNMTVDTGANTSGSINISGTNSTLTGSGNFNMNDSSALSFTLGAAGVSTIDMGGSFNILAGAKMTVNEGAYSGGAGIIDLVTFGSNSSTFADPADVTINGFTGFDASIGYDSDSMFLNLTAVPEPSSTALLGLGGLALIMRRRK